MADRNIFVDEGKNPMKIKRCFWLCASMLQIQHEWCILVCSSWHNVWSAVAPQRKGLAVLEEAQPALAQRAADSGVSSEMQQDFCQASGPIGARFKEAQNLKGELTRSLNELKKQEHV